MRRRSAPSANTFIKQSVNANASDGGFIVITQRAVVFNLGAAIANSGFNSATGVGDMGLTDEQLAALVSLYQILNALLEAGGWALPPGRRSERRSRGRRRRRVAAHRRTRQRSA